MPHIVLDCPSKDQLLCLSRALHYEADTGLFYWKVDRSKKVRKGSKAGYINKKGYVEIRFNYRSYQAHRIAWYIHTGVDPHTYQIDHINNIRMDNRIVNLRLATPAQNACNSKKSLHKTSRYKGVTWYKRKGKWQAQIRTQGKNIHLGYYTDEYKAYMVYKAAAIKYHGEFANFT